MIEYTIEPIAGVWNEILECASDHWGDTAMGMRGEVLNPSLERYEQYEKAGVFFEIVARKDGEMIGFCGMYVMPSMHTQETVATEDIIYIKPEFRNGKNSVRFFMAVNNLMKEMGVKKISVTTPVGGKAIPILEKIGFEVEHIGYSKALT